MKTMLQQVDDHGVLYNGLMFCCPGCALRERNFQNDGLHMLPVNSEVKTPSWTWNEDLEKLTLSPSILTSWQAGDDESTKFVCHSFLVDGVFNFLGDCTHALAGQHAPMPDLPDWITHVPEV